uniref:LNS2/PITP domain-containing protein n=1 Tax=Kalanchoe fedtschenkoi TaxID=63787 RepID=A0A7N1A811_KALFE
MYAVGRIGSYISRGVDTVAAPFHPFGGAVDIIVVQQADGTLKSSPWYVRFGKFQGVLKTKEKVVTVTVNGVDANFHMYLDHKGEAYFLNEVDVEEEDSVLYPSSSDEDTDKQSSSKRFTKSGSSNTEVKQPNSARQADGRDEYRQEVNAWSGSRRARILGLVFGSRSFKEKMSQESTEDEELKRARLLERAEIAADLLELKWSTTLATKKTKQNETLKSSPNPFTPESDNDVVIDKEETQVASIVLEETKHDSDHGELINCPLIMESSDSVCVYAETNVGTTELTSGTKSPMKYSVFVAQESSDTLEISGTKENLVGFDDGLSSGNPDRSNMILESNSVIGIRLVTRDSVDNEMSEVIHPTDVIISRTDGDENTNMQAAEVLGNISHQTSSCSSCISEEEVVEPDVITTMDQPCYHTTIGSPEIDDALDSCPDKVDHQLHDIKTTAQSRSFQTPSVSSDEDLFAFSDLHDSKLTEVHHGESTSMHFNSGVLCGDSDSPKEIDELNNVTYESFSSFDNFDQQKVSFHAEEHVATPIYTHQQAYQNEGRVAGSVPDNWSGIDRPEVIDLHDHCHSLDSYIKPTVLSNDISSVQKAADLFNSDENFSVTDIAGVSKELQRAPVSSKVGVSTEAVDISDKSWGIWPFTFKRSRSMKSSKPVSRSPRKSLSCSYADSTSKLDTDSVKYKPKFTRKKIKTVIPTSEQLASLNLKDGRNEVTFTFSTAMLGDQQVDARIYVWKWNTRVVISDVDGTITRSDVLGQVMPLVGMDWSHIGVTQLFSAIKENGYQLLFLSARAISQAYHTRQFLFNLKQNGQALPDGPVVISPDGLFPSLFREVIRRAPHEFKIACLERHR